MPSHCARATGGGAQIFKGVFRDEAQRARVEWPRVMAVAKGMQTQQETKTCTSADRSAHDMGVGPPSAVALTTRAIRTVSLIAKTGRRQTTPAQPVLPHT